MTHEEACRKSAIQNQRLAAIYHSEFCTKREEGSKFLTSMYSDWAAERSAIARALMGIEGGEE